MKNTPLQNRIERSVKENRSFDHNVAFLESSNSIFDQQPFLEEDSFYAYYLTEDMVKSGDSYADIKCALQARLSLMDFDKNLNKVYHDAQYSIFPKFYFYVNGSALYIKNRFLLNKAVKKAFFKNSIRNMKNTLLYQYYKVKK